MLRVYALYLHGTNRSVNTIFIKSEKNVQAAEPWIGWLKTGEFSRINFNVHKN